MVYFHTKNTNFGIFWSALYGKLYNLLWSNGIFYGQLMHIFYGRLGKFCCHLVYFSRFGMFYKEKSGNPGGEREKCLTGLEKMENRYFDKNV
jgi:hypothetical protein